MSTAFDRSAMRVQPNWRIAREAISGHPELISILFMAAGIIVSGYWAIIGIPARPGCYAIGCVALVGASFTTGRDGNGQR